MRTTVIATVVAAIFGISTAADAQSRNAPRPASRERTNPGASSRRGVVPTPLGRGGAARQTSVLRQPTRRAQPIETRLARPPVPTSRTTPPPAPARPRAMAPARASVSRQPASRDDGDVYDGPDITFDYERQGGPRGPERWTMQLRRGDSITASQVRTIRAHAPNLERFLRSSSPAPAERPAVYRGPDITFQYERQGGPRGPETWTMQLRSGDTLTPAQVRTVRYHASNLERFLSWQD